MVWLCACDIVWHTRFPLQNIFHYAVRRSVVPDSVFEVLAPCFQIYLWQELQKCPLCIIPWAELEKLRPFFKSLLALCDRCAHRLEKFDCSSFVFFNVHQQVRTQLSFTQYTQKAMCFQHCNRMGCWVISCSLCWGAIVRHSIIFWPPGYFQSPNKTEPFLERFCRQSPASNVE